MCSYRVGGGGSQETYSVRLKKISSSIQSHHDSLLVSCRATMHDLYCTCTSEAGMCRSTTPRTRTGTGTWCEAQRRQISISGRHA